MACDPARQRNGKGTAETVRSTSVIVVYSDASGHEGHFGAVVIALDDNLEATESQQIQVGPIGRWSVHVAELIGSCCCYAAQCRRAIDKQQRRFCVTAGQPWGSFSLEELQG
jgi:hypothetical protein